MNGVSDHWAISIEPRNRERSIKLASELTGEEGMVDATSWVQVFMIASKPADSTTGLYGSLAPSRNVNPAEMFAETKSGQGFRDSESRIGSPGRAREKDRGIRKNNKIFNSATYVAVCSVLLAVAGGGGYYSRYPASTWLHLLGVALVLTVLVLACALLSGAIDIRGVIGGPPIKERRAHKRTPDDSSGIR